jgi:hypothetical protein
VSIRSDPTLRWRKIDEAPIEGHPPVALCPQPVGIAGIIGIPRIGIFEWLGRVVAQHHAVIRSLVVGAIIDVLAVKNDVRISLAVEIRMLIQIDLFALKTCRRPK